MPKLILGGMDRPGLLPRSPALGAGASSSMPRRGCTKEHFFYEADMETVNKENQLKELMKTYPKRVKRILRNREYVARLKVQKANHLQDVQRQAVVDIYVICLSEEMVDNLKTEIRELQIKLKGLNEQANLSQGFSDVPLDIHGGDGEKTMAEAEKFIAWRKRYINIPEKPLLHNRYG
ncbi:bZIP transcription factor 29-like [Miscanthus floridulus]|uniref:bZIP transcription factor 29-like n=1 Tax=Miscanthus floridulus TaxID=154761 RepID=UPI0034592E5B